MSEKPAIVIIGGAFQTSDFYDPLKSALENLGFPVVLPTLPTCSNIDRIELGNTSPSDDARVVQREVEALVNQSKRVVVMCHSYGGRVAESLKIKDWTTAARRAKGLEGGVQHMLWFASIASPENMSFRERMGGKIPDFDECMPDGTYNFLIASDTFLDELSPEAHQKWASKLIPHTQKTFDYKVSDAAWKYVSNIVLLTERDKAIPAALQEISAQTVSATKVVRLDMGHGAHLAQTEALAEAISDALEH